MAPIPVTGTRHVVLPDRLLWQRGLNYSAGNSSYNINENNSTICCKIYMQHDTSSINDASVRHRTALHLRMRGFPKHSACASMAV